MEHTITYDEFADALREQGVEPSTAILLQNPANFWENLPDGTREGVVDALDLEVDPHAVAPTVPEDADDEDPEIVFVNADSIEGGPSPPPADAPPGGADAGPGEPGPDLGAGDAGPPVGPEDDGPAGEPEGLGPAGSPGGDPLGPEGEPSDPGLGGSGDGPGSATGASGIEPRDGEAPGEPGVSEVGEDPGGPGGPTGGIDPPDEGPPPGDGPDVEPPEAGDPESPIPSTGPEKPDEPDHDPDEAGVPGPAEGEAAAEAPEGPPAEADPAEPADPDAPEAAEPEPPTPTSEEPDEAGRERLVQDREPGEPGEDASVESAEPLDRLEDVPAASEEDEEEEDDEAGLIDETRDILRRIQGPGGREATEDPDTDRNLVTFEPPSDPDLDVVERYPVNEPYAYIRILYDNEEQQYWYEAREPALTEHEETVLDFIEETLVDVIEVGLSELTEEEADETLVDHFDQIIYDYSISLTERSREKLLYYLKRDFLGYAKIDVLMQDDHIEDISCDGPEISIFLYHRKYESIKSTIRWEDEEDLDSFVIRLAQRSGEHISVAEPLLDATLPDGSRLNSSLSDEVTSKGSTFTIRKFRDDPFTPTDLVRYGTMDVTMMAFWWFVVQHGASAIYAGGTASGKTTSMNAINLFIPPQMKIVSIEDTREISLPHENWIPAFTRSGFGPGQEDGQKGEIDMFSLLKAALRQRPEYIMVGEVRGEEAYALFQAMATGHTAYGTMHADSPSSVIHRLESDPISVPRSLLEALDVISVQIQTRIGDKRVRRTKELVEIVGLDPHTREILTNEVFEWDPATDEFEFSGVSYVLERLQMELNMTDEELDQELERRKAVIRWMLQKDIDDLDDVGRVIATYYKDRDTLMERVWDDLPDDYRTEGGAGLASSDPGLGGEEIDLDLEAEDTGEPGEAAEGDAEPDDELLMEPPTGPDESSAEPGIVGGNGHEPDPQLVALADAAGRHDAPLFGRPYQEGLETALDPLLGAAARAATAAETPPFQPEGHPWADDWPPTPTIDDALGALARGAEPDLGFLPDDHPVRSPPEAGPELGYLARAADPDLGLLPLEGWTPGGTPGTSGPNPGPGEVAEPTLPPGSAGELDREAPSGPEPELASPEPDPDTRNRDPRRVPLEGPTLPTDRAGELSREPPTGPGDEPGPDAPDEAPSEGPPTGEPDWEAPSGPEPDTRNRDPRRVPLEGPTLPTDRAGELSREPPTGPGDEPGPADAGEAPAELPPVGEALGLEAEEARRLEEAGYGDLESLRRASVGELAQAGLDADLRRRLRDALEEGEDEGPPDRDPPDPDEPGPDPPGLGVDRDADEEGTDGAE